MKLCVSLSYLDTFFMSRKPEYRNSAPLTNSQQKWPFLIDYLYEKNILYRITNINDSPTSNMFMHSVITNKISSKIQNPRLESGNRASLKNVKVKDFEFECSMFDNFTFFFICTFYNFNNYDYFNYKRVIYYAIRPKIF